jgi:hypothetical protein
MNFLKGVLSDGDYPSASRVMSLIIVLFGCVWISYLVKVNHAIPDVTGVALLIGVPYGLNVGANAWTAVKGPRVEEKK